MQNFDLALKYVLVDEGGNDDDPQDHGGRTSRGITQREFDTRYSGDVWQATDDQIKSIYHDQYWEPYCDKLPSGVDYLFFDISVNAGRSRAVKSFQQALGIPVDGMVGVITLDAISKVDQVKLIQDVSEVRRNFYKNLAQFPRFGKGWLRRVDHCERQALAMVNVVSAVQKSPKANDKDVSKTSISPEVSGGTVVASGGLMQTLDSFKESLSSYADTISYLKYVLVGIAVISLGYAGYGYYIRSKATQAVQ